MEDHPDFATDISDLHDLVIRHHEEVANLREVLAATMPTLESIANRLTLLEKNWE